jgi:predicted transcriptional regulator of viral defense system
MDYISFKQKFKDRVLISSQEIKLCSPDFDDSQLYRWQRKKYLKKITRGKYIFSDLEISTRHLYYIANKIYEPSYISLETALNIYGLIPEHTYAQTSVSTKKTYSISSPICQFYYKRIKPSLYFGYLVEELKGVKYKIAHPEKALLDYFYLNPDIGSSKQAEDLRIDLEFFVEEYDITKFTKYLERFNSKALSKRVKNIFGDLLC